MSDTYSPDVAAQIPAGGNPNTPPSGEFGEDAALARLDAALPGMDPTQPQATEPLPPVPPGPAIPTAAPGLPAGLLAPTRQPDVPVSTPLQGPAPLIGSGPERRVALLRALVESPDVSVETKEWAQLVLRHYGPQPEPTAAPVPPPLG